MDKSLNFRITLLLIVVLCSFNLALSQESEDALFQTPPLPVGYTSTYTPLTDDACHFLELSSWDVDAPIDYFTLECPAYGGYRIIITGGDLRSWIQVITYTAQGTETYEFYQDVWSHVGQFPYVSGSVLEWRYFWPDLLEARVEGQADVRTAKLVGIIYRVSGSDPDDFTERSKLVAVRLNFGEAPCLVGVVDGNEEARALLDNPTTLCINN